MPLQKSLSFFTLTMYGIGIILGAGIYALIGEAAGLAGNGVWLSFILGAVLASFTGLSYAELSSAYPKASAEANYLKHAFRKEWLAFTIGWLVAVVGFVSAAAVALGFAGYFTAIFPGQIVIVAIALIAILSIVNFIGINLSTKLNVIFTLIEAAGIVLIIVVGAPFFGTVDYFQMENGLTGLFSATAIIFFAYIGFEAIVKLGEETKNAQKVMPRALIVSIIVTSILYILLAVSAVSVLSPAELGATNAPLADVATKAGGGDIGLVLAVIALFATLNTVLIALIVTSRLLYGLGEKHQLPKMFARVHPKTKTPYIAVIFTALGAIAMTLFSDIGIVAKATTFMIFITFFAVNLALIALRYKHPDYKPTFRVPLNIGKFPVIAFLGMASSLFMLFGYSVFEVAITAVFIAIGLLIYGLEKRFFKEK